MSKKNGNPAMERELQRFGKTSWREGQRELIDWVCAGHAALGVLPTGYGKSLCYQIAAQLLGGLSLVISPLIALMRDQVAGLQSLGIAAARYDSSLSDEQRADVLARITSGGLRLLYVAPESLEQQPLLEQLEHATLSLFVIDEAHCVSEWGHSFRPEYLKLPAFARQLRFHALMAMTATATARVQADLQASFGIGSEHSLALPPYRANIARHVLEVEDKNNALLSYLTEEARSPAIIYCRSRQSTEELTALLQSNNLSASAYHAGQSVELREQIQDRFLHNELDILVATIAFGMGVDKPDVRCVIHYHAPATPESYVQESGRAGRDGAPAQSLVLLNHQDDIDTRNRIAASQPDESSLLRCVRWLLPESTRVVSLWELTTECDLNDDVPERALRLMADHLSREAKLYKYYKVKPLFPLSTILDGRDEDECARLRWLDTHREGELEELADAWDCDPIAALAGLHECESAQEWTLNLRQQAWLVRRLDDELQPRLIAEQLRDYYRQQEQQAYARWQRIREMLLHAEEQNIDTALHQYFTSTDENAQEGKELPRAHTPEHSSWTRPSIPSNDQLPSPLNERQRRRFLLGINSPALMRRRLWSHRLYGCCAGASWDDL